MKTRKMLVYPLLFTGRIFLFLYFYIICNNLMFPSLVCFISGNQIVNSFLFIGRSGK
jgi:hypothetical protein